MQFVIKLFPEITIKSKPVRKQMIQRLQNNLANLMRSIDSQIQVKKEWDKMVVNVLTRDAEVIERVKSCLANTPGIAYFLEVDITGFESLDDICQAVADYYLDKLDHKTFVVRCKRAGDHPWSSHAIERSVGAYLNQRCDSASVNLKQADITVNLEVRDKTVYVVKQRIEGLGGYPVGELEPVLSLLSGGFDSPVASFMCIKRGMPTHFVFFNLGGRDHELGVKEVAYYLWSKYSASRRVQFISVPFEGVVAEILDNIDDSQMGVVLKRMMYRAANAVADKMNIKALVTGEAVAQVSSQTISNLAVIDQVTDKLVLRPLISSDKEEIIQLAKQIGTDEFAAAMPEYCGVISVKPTTKARDYRIEHQESRFDFAVLDQALEQARYINIDQMGDIERSEHVEEFQFVVAEAVLIDIRHPDEVLARPLQLKSGSSLTIPFYALHKQIAELDKAGKYLLYCEKGVMSHLHAAHLQDQGFNVAVYRPKKLAH
ncbi:MAG: tRNA 4-thiouridine(8) synthase ThiI [Pseudomonadales bacterium]|nr:tRNA 4-thiouridine(8) synthase ThiI [Pseudomonadales bacterium]